MKRAQLPLIMAFLLLTLVLCAACGSSNGPADTGGSVAPTAAEDMMVNEAPTDQGLTDYDISYSSNGSIYQDANAKLIRTAALTIETLEFDIATATLDALVQSCGGYYGSSEVFGSGSSSSRRSGQYTVRVPRENYDQFMNAVGEVGQLTHRSESTQDVGEEYYDTELRLATLETKHQRLLNLLEQAQDMESIVALQNYLADAEYEIDRHSSSLRRYDALIDYATINIYLEGTVELSKLEQEEGFFQRLGHAFGSGFSNFGKKVDRFFIWFAYHFIGIIIFLLLVAAAIIISVRYHRRRPALPTRTQTPYRPAPPPNGRTETETAAREHDQE